MSDDDHLSAGQPKEPAGLADRDVPLDSAAEIAIAFAVRAAAGGGPVDTRAVFLALLYTDAAARWRRLELLAPVHAIAAASDRDPDPAPGTRWRGVELTGSLVTALRAAVEIATRYGLSPAPPAVLALGLIADQRSAASRAIVAAGVSRCELIDLIQEVLGSRLRGLAALLPELAGCALAPRQWWVAVSNSTDSVGNRVSWLASCAGPYTTETDARDRARELREELHTIIVARTRDLDRYVSIVHRWLTAFDYWAVDDSMLTAAPANGVEVRTGEWDPRSLAGAADERIAALLRAGDVVRDRTLADLRLGERERIFYRAELRLVANHTGRFVLQRSPVCLVTNQRIITVGTPEGTDPHNSAVERSWPLRELNELSTEGQWNSGRDGDCFVAVSTTNSGGACLFLPAPAEAWDLSRGWELERAIRTKARFPADPDENADYLRWLGTVDPDADRRRRWRAKGDT